MDTQVNASVFSDSDEDRFGAEASDSDDDDLAELLAASAAANVVQKLSWGRSQICLEIKPMEFDTDLEKCCTQIMGLHFNENERVMENLKKAQGSEKASDVLNKETILSWGEGYEIVPLAFGICKLVVSCIVVDDCLGTDDLEEAIMELLGDDCQSVDVMSFNKASELKLPKDHVLRA
jgi:translation elongation factor EF-1beta